MGVVSDNLTACVAAWLTVVFLAGGGTDISARLMNYRCINRENRNEVVNLTGRNTGIDSLQCFR